MDNSTSEPYDGDDYEYHYYYDYYPNNFTVYDHPPRVLPKYYYVIAPGLGILFNGLPEHSDYNDGYYIYVTIFLILQSLTSILIESLGIWVIGVSRLLSKAVKTLLIIRSLIQIDCNLHVLFEAHCLLRIFLVILAVYFLREIRAQKPAGCTRPFACFVYEWEEDRSAGRHASATIKEFYDKKCTDTDCPGAKTSKCAPTQIQDHIAAESMLEDGLGFDCNIRELFCASTVSFSKSNPCIPIRKIVKPKPYDSTTKSSQVQFEEFETVMLPVCRLGDTQDECDSLTEKRYCSYDESLQQFRSSYVPWNELSKICTILEAPLGGGEREWVVTMFKAAGEDELSWESPWMFTGLPYKLATETFLVDRPINAGALPNCKPYSTETPGSCNPLPICLSSIDAVYVPKHLEEDEPTPGTIKIGEAPDDPVPCELACENAFGNPIYKTCRVLDIKHMPLFRQGSDPLAQWMTDEENLDLGLLTQAELPPRQTSDPIKYPRPIELDSVYDWEIKEQIEKNYWLSPENNPFYERYKDFLPPLRITNCTNDEEESTIICNRRVVPPRPGELGSNAGLIVGIVFGLLGLLVILVLIGALIAWLIHRHRQNKDNSREGASRTSSPIPQPQPDEQQPLVGENSKGSAAALDV